MKNKPSFSAELSINWGPERLAQVGTAASNARVGHESPRDADFTLVVLVQVLVMKEIMPAAYKLLLIPSLQLWRDT